MKKSFMIILVLLLGLTGCSTSKTRTEVVDVLMENGYSRNSSGIYEKLVDIYKVKLGYIFPGYTNGMLSVQEFFSAGPYAMVDYTGNAYFYFLEDDAYGLTRICGVDEDENILSTEALYFYNVDKWVVGYDKCEIFTDDVPATEVKDAVIQNGDIAKEQVEMLGLSKKDLEKLGE